jgi:tRNA(Ile)-lysidine synthase
MPARREIDWRSRALRLGEAVPMQRLHPSVVAWAETASVRERWGVGFSGGADSLALLLLIWAHWPHRRRKITALHFNHRLRGPAADRDEKFCRSVSRSLGIGFRSGRWTEAKRGASEAEARTARQSFFASEMRRLRSIALWMGHQQDDIAETLLMRLARGSGLGGLGAPRPVQAMPEGRVHLRPLLTMKKREIAEVLKAEGIPWREDATNAGSEFLRNRMRRDVVPAWIQASQGRDVLAGAALSRELIEEDDAALDVWLAEVNPMMSDGALNLRRIKGRPRALVRRALHRWLAVNLTRATLSRQAFNALLDDLMSGRQTLHSIGNKAFAKIGKTKLTLQSTRGKLSN